MSARQLFRLALRGVGSNRLRSALTILGILIGVASVVVLVAVGNGSAIAVKKQFDGLGTNSLTVQAGGFGPGGGRGGARTAAVTLTMKDVAALQDAQYAESIKYVVPIVGVQSVTATYGAASTTPDQFLGATAQLQPAGNYEVKDGRFFTDSDLENRALVAVIGKTMQTNLFGEDVDAVGEKVKFNKVEYEIIGVLKTKGSTGFRDEDNVVIAPWTAVRDTLNGGTSLSQLKIQATSSKTTDAAQTIVTDVIATRNNRNPNDTNKGFQVLNASSLIASSTSTSKTLTVLLGAVAAISLLVGGIGIMNIMLVTVTERTREIGIRKAVGAPKGVILGQFLMESVVLGGIGGIVGVAAGFIGSYFTIVGVKPVVSYPSVVLALLVSVAVSLFFGFYPANRAASLRPIDALRHE
jgi:putative ABC transport system permease protein